MADIIAVRDLVKRFGDVVPTVVLHGLTVSFERGALTAVIGPSGSGKTTLLNIISLLDSPTAGELVVDGRDFSAGDINAYAAYRNAHVGFIFQFHYLLPEFTALENILVPHWIGRGRPPGDVVGKARTLMTELGILHIRDKYPNQISGGEQQRVAVARALVNEPRLVFADEPTGNLDRESGAAVLEVMSRMIRELGTTLVMVTHDREIALKADRILELVDGRICKSFLVAEVGEDHARRLLEDRSCFADDVPPPANRPKTRGGPA
ncbi:MAG: ABC transporter ATP-binding protein [Candidatus Aminicenantes bacterium]|nr:ABC transporter ATP-binding protein [Candidatus Aminicenantes bacterium]